MLLIVQILVDLKHVVFRRRHCERTFVVHQRLLIVKLSTLSRRRRRRRRWSIRLFQRRSKLVVVEKTTVDRNSLAHRCRTSSAILKDWNDVTDPGSGSTKGTQQVVRRQDGDVTQLRSGTTERSKTLTRSWNRTTRQELLLGRGRRVAMDLDGDGLVLNRWRLVRVT